MIDPQRVVQCLPGAELLEHQDERTFVGAIKVKVGPLSMSYKGQAKFTEINEETRQVRMVGDAREVGGSGSTKVSMLSTVAPLAGSAFWAIVVRFFKGLFGGNTKTSIVLLFGLAISVHGQTPRRTMTVTIDDLPYVQHGGGPYVARARVATSKILNTLKKHKAPAIGFVNESKLEVAGEREERIALLRQWIDNGMTLGNHTYSHPDFNGLTIEQFENEIAKGDVVTRQLMQARQPYQLYFRHPMTHTGDTQEKKEAIDNFLAARGYKVTPHTIENSDYIFTIPYAAAMQKKDAALAKRLRDEYISHTLAVTEFAEKISPQVFGREIPQTLLIHVNDITADCLDEMLKKFEERGYTFVTLDVVMADPAYQTKDTYVSKFGPSWLFRWMKSKGMDVDFATDPEPAKWVMDSYRKITGFTNH